MSLTIDEGEAVALLGANGAGKSTLMKCIMGLLACSSGHVRLAGQDLARRPVSDRAALGVGYSPEGRRIFPGLTVHENLLVASRDKDDGRARAEDIYAKAKKEYDSAVSERGAYAEDIHEAVSAAWTMHRKREDLDGQAHDSGGLQPEKVRQCRCAETVPGVHRDP